MSRITVVGLGPAGPEFLTVETTELLGGDVPLWLRTTRHPAAGGLEFAGSFDEQYETAESFDDVYGAIVDRLIDLARVGDVIYAVPGSPTVAERTVELLRVHDDVTGGLVQLDIRPAMAFTDLCWNALGIDPMAEAVTILDALNLSIQGAGRVGPLLITQVHSVEVLEEVIGILDDVSPDVVTVLQGLGTPAEMVTEVAWRDLRSGVEPDHLTSLWIPRLAEPLAASFVRLDELVRQLRLESPEIAELSFDSIRATLPEASAGVVDAMYGVLNGESDAALELEDGLADMLFLLVLHSRLAAEAGYFTIEDVASSAIARQQ